MRFRTRGREAELKNIISNIILIGYMGCGKTTVGKRLAELMDFTFVDTDEMIERQQGRTISEIFGTDGEQMFRTMETTLLEQMLEGKNGRLVISTGGGMPLREENRALLSKLGTVVYLKAEPKTIYDRVKGDANRPLLQCADPFAKIQEMLAARQPVYEAAADSIMQADAPEAGEIAELIRDLLQQRQ